MATPKKTSSPAKSDAAEATTETISTSNSDLAVVHNNSFEVVDNTEEASGVTEAPKQGKEVKRKEKLNGFEVVDYK